MKNRFTIAFDLDGVLFDTEGLFCERFGFNKREEYNFVRRYPEHADLIDEFLNDPYTYSSSAPIFGGFTMLRQALMKGFGIVYITSRPITTYDASWVALAEYSLPEAQIIFTQDKPSAIETYNKHLPNAPIKMMVDDSLGVLASLPSNILGVAWEQPWNQGWYPRAKYNETEMEIKVQSGADEPWIGFWGGLR